MESEVSQKWSNLKLDHVSSGLFRSHQVSSCLILCLSNILQRSLSTNCRVSDWMCRFKFHQQIELCKRILARHWVSSMLKAPRCNTHPAWLGVAKSFSRGSYLPPRPERAMSGLPSLRLVEVPEKSVLFPGLAQNHFNTSWGKSFWSPQTISTNKLTKDKTKKTHSKGIKGLSARTPLANPMQSIVNRIDRRNDCQNGKSAEHTFMWSNLPSGTHLEFPANNSDFLHFNIILILLRLTKVSETIC